MSRRSPTLEGFRAAWRRPSLTFAEISWRWMVGATAWALLIFSFLEYLRTLPVTNSDLLLLRTRHPLLVGQAIGHILHGSLERAVLATLAAALAVAFLWMIAAAAGRVATIRALLDHFRRDVAGNVSTNGPFKRAAFRSLAGLNFLRSALALAALLGIVGATILAGFASSSTDPKPGLVFFLFLPMAGLICLVWWILNWFLSLAGLFAVRDSQDTLGALSSAVAFSRERLGPVLAVSIWFGLIHLALFIGATTVFSTPLGFAPFVPGRLLLASEVVLALGYCAIADWLYMARLAGYVCIAEMPEGLLAPPPPSPLLPQVPLQTSIDRGESILSDVPGLA